MQPAAPNSPNRPYSHASFRGGTIPGVCWRSGSAVFDEMFRDGRLVCRYWNANGQIWPEMHFENTAWAEDQPADTFHLAINRHDLAGGYSWLGAEATPDPSAYRQGVSGSDELPVTHGVIRLAHAEAGVEVAVHTRLDGGPFIIRWLEITNLSSVSVAISSVSPFAGALWAHRYEEHLPAGLSSPFEVAYNHAFEWGHEGDFWFQPLMPGVFAVDGGKKGRSGWGRPAFWARNLCNGQTFVCELAWGGNYEFALDCRFHPRTAQDPTRLDTPRAELYFRMGLSGYDEALRVVEPGQTVTTPAVHAALFHADTDDIVQVTHEHVRHVVMPAQIPGREVEIEANHRGYLCDRENVPDILKDVDVAAAIGTEMYVIDAGWYGNEPNQWGNNVGDWHDGAWMKEGGGLKAVADYVHEKGLKFGLWVEIEAAGANSTLKKEHPDWLMTRDGEPIAGGRALDLTKPEVAGFVEREIERLMQTYDLDMFRIDHNHCIQPAGNRRFQGFTEDLIWRYYDMLYGIFDRLRARFPNVVFQNCAGGGGRLDWGTLARFHNTELSDWMRMPRGLKILNGVTMSLPPEILLRTFGTEVGEHALEGDVHTQLRLCFCRPIFRGIAPSMDALTPCLRDRITHYLEVFRKHIRPIMRDGLVFHHTPFLSHQEITPWCVLEYASPDRDRAVAAVFRTSAEGPGEYLFRPRGLDLSTTYRVVLDNRNQSFQTTGRDLVTDGVRLQIDRTLASELIVCEAVR